MNNEYEQADPQFRRKLFSIYLMGLTLLGAAIIIGKDIVTDQLNELRGVSYIRYIEQVEGLLLSVVIFPAIYLIWLGRRIVKDQRFPYNGMKVIRKTKIVRDKKAVHLGRKFMISGVVSILIIISSLVMNHRINSEFIADPFNYTPRFFWNR